LKDLSQTMLASTRKYAFNFIYIAQRKCAFGIEKNERHAEK